MTTPSIFKSKEMLFEGKVLPAHIDFELRKHIALYISKPHQTASSLHKQMDAYVREQFRNAQSLVDDGVITPEEFEKQITSNRPSPDYLVKYKNGTPICMRYTNTIANFFGISFTFNTYNPADDMLEGLSLEGKI